MENLDSRFIDTTCKKDGMSKHCLAPTARTDDRISRLKFLELSMPGIEISPVRHRRSISYELPKCFVAFMPFVKGRPTTEEERSRDRKKERKRKEKCVASSIAVSVGAARRP